jgi:hypothetical protein
MFAGPPISLLLITLIALTACAASPSLAVAPAATPVPNARQQAAEAAPGDRVELASGHYQLLMLYSPQ